MNKKWRPIMKQCLLLTTWVLLLIPEIYQMTTLKGLSPLQDCTAISYSLPSLVQRNGSVFLQCFAHIFSVYIYSLIAICCEVIKNRSWNKELISTNVIMQRAPSYVCGIFPPLHSPQFKNSKLRPKSCWNAKRGGFPKPILSIKTSNLK